jgi:hypothetical protein
MTNEVSARRIAAFLVAAVAIVVVTLAIGLLLATPQPADRPFETPGPVSPPPAQPTAAPPSLITNRPSIEGPSLLPGNSYLGPSIEIPPPP